ncbi:hypothetical protein L195_g043493 [Trifolium pratense]|uniref:Uncharacterized protein n=1 Tax=Trifolium pratense TaxID=57577 RepID=A0A2K3M9F0_TRIPR|nr:hypothetical protein L195_g043493 [Trifolium pratense]
MNAAKNLAAVTASNNSVRRLTICSSNGFYESGTEYRFSSCSASGSEWFPAKCVGQYRVLSRRGDDLL